MAISPEKAGQITQDEIKAIEEVEKKIDKILQAEFQGHGDVRVTKHFGSLSDRCQEELLQRYRSAGWSIAKEHEDAGGDPRGGSYDYWLFKSAPVVRHSGFADQVNNSAPPPWRDDGPINPNWR